MVPTTIAVTITFMEAYRKTSMESLFNCLHWNKTH